MMTLTLSKILSSKHKNRSFSKEARIKVLIVPITRLKKVELTKMTHSQMQ